MVTSRGQQSPESFPNSSLVAANTLSGVGGGRGGSQGRSVYTPSSEALKALYEGIRRAREETPRYPRKRTKKPDIQSPQPRNRAAYYPSPPAHLTPHS